MKTPGNYSKTLVVAVLYYLPFIVFSQEDGWRWQNPYPQGNDLNSITIDGTLGWAVGPMGTVIKTEDAGFTWEMVDLGTSENLNCVYMHQISKTGWIVGNKGLIFYTDNGGESWVKQRSGTTEDLYSLAAIEGYCPWICGNDIILNSHNHGENWDWVSTSFHSYFFSIDLKECNEAWISGMQGLLISTSDDGATWQSHTSGTTNNLYCIDIVANGKYRACGYTGTIIMSDDGGTTWVKEHEKTFLQLNNIEIKGIGGPTYAVGGDGTILETLDGGITWTQRESGVFTYLNDVCYQGWMHRVYVVGWYGIILRKDDEAGAEFEIMNERPVHFMIGLDFLDKNTGWAVGGKEVDEDTEEGVILHTSNGGETWEVQKTLDEQLMSVDFINENEGWAVGENGAIRHTINGGQSWTTQTSPMTGLLTAVFFIDENNGWIVSRDNWGEICHTTNGGSTWTLQTEYSLNPFNDVFFINPETGWAVGMDTTIMRTHDGGQTWLNCDVDVYGNPYLRSVQFIDDQKGWTVGTGGAILMSNDGGVSWQEIHTGFYDLLQSVCFTDPLNGWASGTDGNILRTIDGGYTWFKQYSGMNRYITAVCFVDSLNGWIAGEGGAIKRTTNGGFWNEPGTFLRNRMNRPIMDHAETSDTMMVQVMQTRESGYELVGVELMLDSIMHPRASDLEINLTHNNVTATFVSHVADPGADFLWMRLKDNATKLIADGAAPFSGDYKPHTPLNAFNGLDPDGEWILTISDNQSGHTGTLKAWGIKPLFERLVSVKEPPNMGAEQQIRLSQNRPNPFSIITQISWESEINGHTTLKVYDNQGKVIAVLMDKSLPRGEYSVEFNGAGLSAGVYYYSLQVGDVVISRKCIIR